MILSMLTTSFPFAKGTADWIRLGRSSEVEWEDFRVGLKVDRFFLLKLNAGLCT